MLVEMMATSSSASLSLHNCHVVHYLADAQKNSIISLYRPIKSSKSKFIVRGDATGLAKRSFSSIIKSTHVVIILSTVSDVMKGNNGKNEWNIWY